MNKKELIDKLKEAEDMALNIDQLDGIANALRQTGLDINTNPIMKSAVMIGYAEMIKKVYKDTRLIWIRLVNISDTLSKELKEEPERTIDTDEEVTEDDLAFQ